MDPEYQMRMGLSQSPVFRGVTGINEHLARMLVCLLAVGWR
jgi:hypothetical protein